MTPVSNRADGGNANGRVSAPNERARARQGKSKSVPRQSRGLWRGTIAHRARAPNKAHGSAVGRIVQEPSLARTTHFRFEVDPLSAVCFTFPLPACSFFDACFFACSLCFLCDAVSF